MRSSRWRSSHTMHDRIRRMAAKSYKGLRSQVTSASAVEAAHARKKNDYTSDIAEKPSRYFIRPMAVFISHSHDPQRP